MLLTLRVMFCMQRPVYLAQTPLYCLLQGMGQKDDIGETRLFQQPLSSAGAGIPVDWLLRL